MMCTVKEAAVPKAATVGVLHLYHIGSRAAASDQKAARYPPSRLRRRCFCLSVVECDTWLLLTCLCSHTNPSLVFSMSSTTSTIVKVGCSLLGGAALLYVTKRLWEKKGTTASKECYFVGIDLGATNAKAGVVKDDGELIATSSEPLSDYSDTGVVRSLVKVCNNALEAAGLKWSDIGEIGIGSPGTIDFDVVYYTYRLFIEWHCY